MASEAIPAPKPYRGWPTAALAGVYWIFQIVNAQMDMPMFARFLSGALSALLFLVLFLLLWLSNGTLPGRVRLLGLGLILSGAALGILLSHKSFQAMGFLMTSVPPVLTAGALWIYLARLWKPRTAVAVLSAGILGGFLYFDLIRWDGLDGSLRSSTSWSLTPTEEAAYLASRNAAAPTSTKAWSLKSGDWPEFRGARRDGVVHGLRIETNWKDVPPTLLWKHRAGPGWSSAVLIDGFLVTQEQRGESEAVVCYEAESGREVWAHEDQARFTEGIAGAGPRATPTFREGRLYTLGGSGIVNCLEASTGNVVWRRDLHQGSAATPPQWGYAASPLVVDGKVIVFAGGPSASGIVALDAATGTPVWTKLAGKESYASAQLLTVRGKPQLLMSDNKSLAALAVADGATLWERPNPSEAVIPMLQSSPVDYTRVLVAAGQGLALLELKEEGGKWNAAELWSTAKFRPSFSNFVLHDGHVYGFDEGVLACVDLRTGERVWRKGRYGNGQLILLADQGLLILISEKGELALVEAKPQEPGEIVRIPSIEGKTWNHPAVAQDRIIVRNGTEMACYRLRPLKSP